MIEEHLDAMYKILCARGVDSADEGTQSYKEDELIQHIVDIRSELAKPKVEPQKAQQEKDIELVKEALEVLGKQFPAESVYAQEAFERILERTLPEYEDGTLYIEENEEDGSPWFVFENYEQDFSVVLGEGPTPRAAVLAALEKLEEK